MNKQTNIIEKKKAKHYTWGTNCDSWIFLDTSDLSVKLEKMPPKTNEKLHYHSKTQQFFYILEGEATFFIEEEKINLSRVSSNFTATKS